MRRKSYGMRWAIQGKNWLSIMGAEWTKADTMAFMADTQRIIRVEILAAPTTKRKGRAK